ncbi:hypothetical protein BH11PLA2_BH11PLA2_12950 [soil metagenome]
MRRLTVLITNWTLHGRHGSVLYIRDLALGLLRAGARPVVYSPESGEIVHELTTATVPVIHDLNHLADAPDIIHTNSGADGLMALMHFPQTPAVCVSHAWNNPLTVPLQLRRVRRFVAVDDTCRDDLTARHGIPSHRVEVHQNGVDLQRFRPRPPLPPRPRNALIFSNYAAADGYALAVSQGCAAAGIALTVVGECMGTQTATPETVLPNYDVIFAKGRAATEAVAVGCAVILCDTAGFGGLVTSQNWQALRRLNFGRRSLQQPATAARVQEALSQYDAVDAGIVAESVRREADVTVKVADLLALYETVIAEYLSDDDKDLELRAMADSLQLFLPYISGLERGAGDDRRRHRIIRDQLITLQELMRARAS